MDLDLLIIPHKLLENMPLMWTYLLLMARFTALMLAIPGIGAGMHGLAVRAPAVMILALTSLGTSPSAVMPESTLTIVLQVVSEFMFGSILGLLPQMIVAGVQTGAHLASTTMGLQASQLIDPTTQTSLPDLAQLYGNIVIILYLLLGGHHLAIEAASSLSGSIVPGTFFPTGITVQELITRSGDIFRLGVVLSAPVIVALLLTNFVMGLITKVVPTVNIFIVSFPLTIGIGLILSILVLPEVMIVVKREFQILEPALSRVLQDVGRI